MKVLSKPTASLLLELKKHTNNLKFYSAIFFLRRLLENYNNDVKIIHQKKINKLYGGNIYFPENTSKILNISDYSLDENEQSLLEKGLNFGLKKKPNFIKRQIEIEKLYTKLKNLERTNKITIKDDERLKTKLKYLGYCPLNERSLDPLSKNEKRNKEIKIKLRYNYTKTR